MPGPSEEGSVAVGAALTALQARIDELEVRLSFQDELLRQIDLVVVGLSDRVLELSRRVDSVGQELEEMNQPGPRPPGDDTPPHY